MRLKTFATFLLDRLWPSWFPNAFLRISDCEDVYRRIPPGSVIGGFVTPAVIKFPEPSCVRSRWSVPLDVIRPKCCRGVRLVGYGVISIAVRLIRNELKVVEQERSLLFDVSAKPKRGCFAHSEISSPTVLPSRAGLSIEELGDKERAEIRAALAYRCNLLIAPESRDK